MSGLPERQLQFWVLGELQSYQFHRVLNLHEDHGLSFRRILVDDWPHSTCVW